MNAPRVRVPKPSSPIVPVDLARHYARLRPLSPALRREVIATLDAETASTMLHAWRELWARPDQLPPAGAWRTWLICAGRGAGKTRCLAEWVRECARTPGARIALAAATAADVRDTIILGESGVIAVHPERERPTYVPSNRRLTWPNGSIALALSAEEPDRARGLQWTHVAADEICAWWDPDMWDQLQLGLRLGRDPKSMIATTPRPTPLLRRIMADPGTVTVRGSTYDNRENLAPPFLAEIVSRYEGTRLGRQEIHAEILDDTPGALWKRADIDAARVTKAPDVLAAIVVAVDPAVSTSETSDETGMVVAGVDDAGELYVLEDASGRMSPAEWARRAVNLCHRWKAVSIVAESNQGGEMVGHTIRTIDGSAPVKLVHASKGKRTRAEPVASLYEQRRAHHVGHFPALEDQLTTWDAAANAKSPDRMDALVWAATELLPWLSESPESQAIRHPFKRGSPEEAAATEETMRGELQRMMRERQEARSEEAGWLTFV